MALPPLSNAISDERFSVSTLSDQQVTQLFLATARGEDALVGSLLAQTDDLSQKPLQDALCQAAKAGHASIVELMLQKGVNPRPGKASAASSDSSCDALTAMGCAIENRQSAVIKVLLQNGVNIEEISPEEWEPEGALDLFFFNHATLGYNPAVLQLLLVNGAKVHSLQQETIFAISLYASAEELSLLLAAGFDPRSAYSPGVQVLDLAVMQAERAHVFREKDDSIEKVRLLLEKKEVQDLSDDACQQNYLHKVSVPELIQRFGASGVDVKAQALFDKECSQTFTPIEAAHTAEVVDLICSFGENRENAPFLQGTQAHLRALERMHVVSELTLTPFNDQGALFLVQAAECRDIAAFVALIGAGVDVNRANVSGWTCLHTLFSVLGQNRVNRKSDADDLLLIASNAEIRFINILIQHGAFPLKDGAGQTPLMCLSLLPRSKAFNSKIINIYIDFEAAYYHLDPEEYRKKFFKLRDKGIFLEEKCINKPFSAPVQKVFNRFWASFETHSEFDP
jgi:ankyrin repeat protein